MATKIVTVKVTTTGGAGVAVGSAESGVPGGIARLLSYSIKYTSQPVTTDVTLTAEETSGVTKTLATISNANTDLAQRQPLEAAVDNLGVDVANTENPNLVSPIVTGNLKVDVAQGDAATDAVEVRFVLEV